MHGILLVLANSRYDRYGLIFMEIFSKKKNWEIIFEIKVIFCIYLNVFYLSAENV